jgi:hypothetical protein
MSLLEELIGASLDEMSDEELEQAIIEGRLGREQTDEPKVKKAGKKKAPAVERLDIDMSDFD